MISLTPSKYFAFVSSRFIIAFACFVFLTNVTASDVPRVPFSGVYGATAGGGSLTGWNRRGGDNPAIMASPGYGASLSGYAPFGLEDVRVTELEVSRDAARWGASVGWRHLKDEQGLDASRVRAQGAWRWSSRVSVGGYLAGYAPGEKSFGGGSENEGWGAGLGMTARPHRAVTLGFAGELVPTAFDRVARAGLGMDVGTSLHHVLGRGSAWRMSAEYFREMNLMSHVTSAEWRFAGALQLHALLGIYAGYSPALETVALGVRFGMGGWEGFSAMRRHGSLGGTAIQGLGWGRITRGGQ